MRKAIVVVAAFSGMALIFIVAVSVALEVQQISRGCVSQRAP